MKGRGGYTFIECVIVLLIASIFLLMAVPSFQHFSRLSTSCAVQRDLLRAIELARNEAVLNSVDTRLCASADGRHCCADWSRGFLVLSADEPLRWFEAPEGGKLRFRAFSNSNRLRFRAKGAVLSQNGRFTYSPAASHVGGWQIIINRAGRARVVAL